VIRVPAAAAAAAETAVRRQQQQQQQQQFKGVLGEVGDEGASCRGSGGSNKRGHITGAAAASN
jgi:hypothetical protein